MIIVVPFQPTVSRNCRARMLIRGFARLHRHTEGADIVLSARVREAARDLFMHQTALDDHLYGVRYKAPTLPVSRSKGDSEVLVYGHYSTPLLYGTANEDCYVTCFEICFR